MYLDCFEYKSLNLSLSHSMHDTFAKLLFIAFFTLTNTNKIYMVFVDIISKD